MSDQRRNLWVWLRRHGMAIDWADLRVEFKARPVGFAIEGAGNGLFATKSCPSSTILFTIPASAMINTQTLAPHYPSPSSLTAVQLISLHLLLYRPIRDSQSSDPLFGPYISVLPRGFESHPLTWLIEHQRQRKNDGTILLDSLPPSATRALREVSRKFWDDWKAVRQYMKHPHVIQKSGRSELRSIDKTSMDSFLCDDFLWGWLNVNTRCIYYQLNISRTSPDNLTMCPILDFANHTNTSKHMSPVPPDPRSWLTPSMKKAGDFTFLAPRDVLQEGEEIYLCYGAHANRTLFVEYGFINELRETTPVLDEFNGEVDVQDILERLFEDRGTLGMWMKSVLEDNGYWGDWTLHSSPSPAHPSYRLITALRLYHTTFESASGTDIREAALRPWQDTLLGIRNMVSEENETAWRESLIQICETLTSRAKVGLSKLVTRPTSFDNASWLAWMQDNIKSLWQEEALVAAAVSDSVREGTQF